jgi:hypothetical protein
MSRYGKRRDLVVHEEEPFNAETGLAALAEGPLTATDAFYVRGGTPRCPRSTRPRGGCTCMASSSGSLTCPSPLCARRSGSAR